jgi:elongation factor Ts
MAITAEQVRELRERTGAGLMECKKALEAASGDITAAIEAMRKSGQAKADKKAGRIAAEGAVICFTSTDSKTAAILEVNCETDFVARDESFQEFAKAAATTALVTKTQDVNTLMSLPLAMECVQTVEQARQALIAKIGENIQIRRIAIVTTNGVIATYIHGGRIGVVVKLTQGDEQLGKDLAMHIAANNPLVVNRDEVPADLVAKEKEIFSVQAQASGKPAAIIEKMIEGRINKFLDEVSLLGQPFVKDPNMTVAQLLAKSNAKIEGFVRYAVGEGIEKQEENFREAVMAQVRGE